MWHSLPHCSAFWQGRIPITWSLDTEIGELIISGEGIMASYSSSKENFGYEYGGLATITGLAVDSTYTKLEIRTYVTTFDGKVKYGKAGTLVYTGALDADGYPTLEVVTE